MILKTKNKLLNCLSIGLMLILAKCSVDKLEKRSIHFDNFKQLTLTGEECAAVRILKIYPNEEPCKGKKINANLYICRNVKNGDTLYVFDICEKVPAFALADNFNENVCIMKENIKKTIPKKVTIYVPESLSIQHNSKYVFSDLIFLYD